MRTFVQLITVSAALLLLGACPVVDGEPEPDPSASYEVAEGAIWTPDGHALGLRGVNLHEDAKWTEGHLVPLDDQERELVVRSGFNSVRMLTFWGAITPEPGVVDEAYLDGLEAEVQALSAEGLYIVLDMHQDLWGEPFGNGAPEWACPAELKESTRRRVRATTATAPPWPPPSTGSTTATGRRASRCGSASGAA